VQKKRLRFDHSPDQGDGDPRFGYIGQAESRKIVISVAGRLRLARNDLRISARDKEGMEGMECVS